MSNIIEFTGATLGEIAPDLVLKAAEGKLTKVLILGEDAAGNEYFASSTGDNKEILWLLESLKFNIMSGEYGE